MSALKKFIVAIETAKLSTMQAQLGAVLVENGKIVSKGFNNRRTKIGKRIDMSVHAEVDALCRYRKTKNHLSRYRERGVLFEFQ